MTILSGVPKNAEALAVAEWIARHGGRVLHVAASDRDMETMEAALAFFAPGAGVLRFPAWDCMPYDRASPRSTVMAERMRTLSALASPLPCTGEGSGGKAAAGEGIPQIILTTANAVLQKLPPRAVMRHAVLELKPGQSLPQTRLVEALLAQGYRRSGKAMEPGEFALRGGIVDIVPPGMNDGARVDFFGDEIESIRPFDPLTQITSGLLPKLTLAPVSEVLLSEETLTRFRTAYRETFGAATGDPLYESLSAGRTWPGMEHWLPMFYDHTETLPDYCTGATVMLDADAEAALAERWESILDYYQARVDALSRRGKETGFAAGGVYRPVAPESLFVMEPAWEAALAAHPQVKFSPFAESGQQAYKPAIRFVPATGENPFDQLKQRVDRAAAAGQSTLLACFSGGSRERLLTLLGERGFHARRIEHWGEAHEISSRGIGLAVLPIDNGFETAKVLILSEQDVLGERIARAAKKKKPSDVFLQEAANFAEGELVVHKEHGIGRFEGLTTLTVSSAAHDCLKIIYEGGDKLFLPVENIEMVSRFGLEEEGVKLDKLGGASWQSRKSKLKERILMAAEELLKIAAQRQIKEAPVLETPPGSYDDFAARFGYPETEDQQRAIDEVRADLTAGKPMDRLVCGDVGFGKTEVALRAAFLACHPARREASAQNPVPHEILRSHASHVPQDDRYQVAVIVPTTLLARQHYANFTERFAGFPVTIRQLSRMVPARAQAQTREMLKDGRCDIVIGTHALLSKNIQFKNLGLLIVDEEQHFGVAQKEKLKQLKSDVHVLTLTATPIPRTLQMALTGVRSLSLITTPPVDRLAIRSYVTPFDPVVLREAILRELHRGGKCFAVTPRIKTIGEFKKQLLDLVPEARIAIGHGQMPPAELDRVMNDFYDGKYDILLSTSIIESGLDIPSANTIIIHHAHLFGLAQLYQMRGRVGRGKLRAYAYFLLPPYRELSGNATKRLEVMQTLDTLGAGFTLASHDMDIRGFGNLVGEEQSGHIREVGIELYQQMLEEAVKQLRVKDSPARNSQLEARNSTDWSPQINLGLSVLIPESYIDDLSLRLGLYRRAAGLSTEAEIDAFAAELIDRFGAMPQEVQALISVLGIKILCKRAGIERIDAGPKGAVISLKNNVFSNPDALLAYIGKHTRTLKVRGDQKLVFTHEWKGAEDKLTTVKKLAGEIAGLA